MLDSERLRNALHPYFGALAGLATPDSAARRRHNDADVGLYQSDPDDSPFQEDIRRIRASFARSRTGNLTQVFVPVPNPRVSTRLTHCDGAADIAKTSAYYLGLNRFRCEAGMLIHDGGHTVRGHRGEAALGRISGLPFRHEEFVCTILQHVENKGRGLNLTHQTLSIALNHSRGHGSMDVAGSAEETLGMYADKIHYILWDYPDFSKADCGRRELAARPRITELALALGATREERLENCVVALVQESAEAGQVSFSTSEVARRFVALRGAMLGDGGIYRAVNPKAGEERLFDAVHEVLADVLPDCDPNVAFALLDDREFDRIVGVLLEGRSVTEDDLRQLPIWTVREQIVKGRLNIVVPDMDW